MCFEHLTSSSILFRKVTNGVKSASDRMPCVMFGKSTVRFDWGPVGKRRDRCLRHHARSTTMKQKLSAEKSPPRCRRQLKYPLPSSLLSITRAQELTQSFLSHTKWEREGGAQSPLWTIWVHVGPIPSNSTTISSPGMCPMCLRMTASESSVLFESGKK